MYVIRIETKHSDLLGNYLNAHSGKGWAGSQEPETIQISHMGCRKPVAEAITTASHGLC